MFGQCVKNQKLMLVKQTPCSLGFLVYLSYIYIYNNNNNNIYIYICIQKYILNSEPIIRKTEFSSLPSQAPEHSVASFFHLSTSGTGT